MRFTCEFIMREVAGETILVPIGTTALKFNGIITLEPVGTLIWKGIEAGKDREAILQQILDEFDVDVPTAELDLDTFLKQLQDKGFLE